MIHVLLITHLCDIKYSIQLKNGNRAIIETDGADKNPKACRFHSQQTNCHLAWSAEVKVHPVVNFEHTKSSAINDAFSSGKFVPINYVRYILPLNLVAL